MGSKVTIKEIARALNTSMMTVSRAINDHPNIKKETRSRVLQKAREMGYVQNKVAKSLVSQKTYTIGAIVPNISHTFFPEVIRGIDEVINQSNYQLILTNTNEQFEREKKIINELKAQRVDGILISTSLKINDYSFYEDLVNTGPEIVFFDRYIEGIGASCVSVNDRNSSKQITRHLIDTHKLTKIAYLYGPDKVKISQERLKGYKEAHREREISINTKWVIEAGFKEEEGYQAMKKILELSLQDYPEAVVAVNDPVAIGAINALKEADILIPQDIAIVGFTDEIRASLLPTPLTTVHQPSYSLGKKATIKLLRTIENDNEPVENIEILTALRIRNSCGCR